MDWSDELYVHANTLMVNREPVKQLGFCNVELLSSDILASK